jgi:SRSO17 transposase
VPRPLHGFGQTIDSDVPLRRLVDRAKMRRRVKRDYDNLKQETGLGHCEDRGWPDFHHHGTCTWQPTVS